MEEGPFRMPRPADRSANSGPAPAHPPVQEPKIVEEEPKPVQRTTTAHHTPKEKKSKKSLLVILASVIVALLVIFGGWAFFTNTTNAGAAIDGSKYQAVFFTNGQVYFGKLHAFNDDYMKLDNIFYLQTKTVATDPKNPQKTTDESNDVQLIKLGDEIHGPQDEMVISKAQILFYENLKADGKVATSISQYKK
mgnify:CR=1 FL=1